MTPLHQLGLQLGISAPQGSIIAALTDPRDSGQEAMSEHENTESATLPLAQYTHLLRIQEDMITSLDSEKTALEQRNQELEKCLSATRENTDILQHKLQDISKKLEESEASSAAIARRLQSCEQEMKTITSTAPENQPFAFGAQSPPQAFEFGVRDLAPDAALKGIKIAHNALNAPAKFEFGESFKQLNPFQPAAQVPITPVTTPEMPQPKENDGVGYWKASNENDKLYFCKRVKKGECVGDSSKYETNGALKKAFPDLDMDAQPCVYGGKDRKDDLKRRNHAKQKQLCVDCWNAARVASSEAC
ncbi:Hypothetical predicted protein [Lecanosticta acicola]|uniref:Uncharacterized protein n=1 Tax=Lecanosticta acicola TaxID=111012 RepID=A0AAI8Z449_9PEZI|nr:Hypothetical predicted protein [Lecanosticta acicola]